MKTEYIPGDLVMFKDEVVMINEVDNAAGCKDPFIYTTCTNKRKSFYERSSKLKPIPITEKILEKNGWTKRVRVSYKEEKLQDFSKDDFPLEHFAIAFTKEGIKATYDCLYVRDLKYVTDLQHLLFGLGLDSNIQL